MAISLLSACSEARYAAHVAKQIPFPGDETDNVGHYKVGNSYDIQGRRYQPKETFNHTETGMASWYGPGFHNKRTANGEIFDENELTAAHRTLQLPSIIRVINLANGRSVILRVNDRGPFARDRILDVSKRAASLLGFKDKGTTKIRLEVLGDASREVAERSKQGYSTKGYEVALNQKQPLPPIQKQYVSGNTTQGAYTSSPPLPQPSIKPMQNIEPVTRVALSSPNATTGPEGNIISQPVPLRKPLPVQTESLNAPTMTNPPLPPALGAGRVYVQAGAFSSEQNALNFSSQMASYGPSKVYFSRVNDKPFYRVRLGPYENREQAGRVLDVLNQGGNKNAVIVFD